MNTLVALQGQQPDINPVGAYQNAQANAVQIKGEQQRQAMQGLQTIGSMALGVMDGNINGTPDPQRWEQALDMLSQQGIDVEQFRGRANMAPVIARSSMTAMQQLQNARSDQQMEMAMQQFQRSIFESDRNYGLQQQRFAFDQQQAAQPAPQYTQLTPEEVTAAGLDPEKAWQRAPTGQITQIGGSGQTINVGGASESSFNTEAGKLQAQRFDELVQAGHAAQSMVSDISALAELGAQIETGKGAEIVSALGPWAEQFGVDIEGLGENQAFNAIVARLTPTMRVAGSGATSDMEMRKFAESLPGLGKTPEGNQMIQNTLQALAEHKIEAARIAAEAISGNITPREADQQIAALPDPLSLWKQNGQQLLAGSPDTPDAPEGVDPELWRYMTPEERALWN